MTNSNLKYIVSVGALASWIGAIPSVSFASTEPKDPNFLDSTEPTSYRAKQPLVAYANWTGEDAKPNRSTHARDTTSTDVSPFSPGSNNISLDLGQIFLMGDLTKSYQNTIGTQLHYNYGVSDLFSFDSSMGYSQHSDGKLSLFSLLAGVRMNFSWFDRIIPYGEFGLGFYVPSFIDTTGGPGTSTSINAILFGIHLGPGVDLILSKNVFFGASLVVNDMFGTSKGLANGTALYVGGAYTTFYLHMGVTF